MAPPHHDRDTYRYYADEYLAPALIKPIPFTPRGKVTRVLYPRTTPSPPFHNAQQHIQH
jgi:hypothetical protein